VLVAVETADCADRKEDREGAVETIVAYAVWERNVGQSNMLELIGSPLKIGGWNLLHSEPNITTGRMMVDNFEQDF